jgi:RNA polymerase sigma factor (sigma-70 family)
LSDGQLLERFTTRDGDAAEYAFAALVERHGPMVLRVCRNLVSDQHEAQDAFQATFLVLLQQARRLWVRDSLAPWLHRVARRVASRIQASRRQRRAHERRAAESRPARHAGELDWRELVTVLHEEIDLLPARLRTPVVLCDLQGMTHERAAKSLGWPVGTLKSRLGRARELLRGRLSRRGLVLPAGVMIAEVTANAAEAPLSLALVDSLVQAGIDLAARRPVTLGVISSRVAKLTEEVQKTMLITRFKVISLAELVGGSVLAGAAGVLGQQGNADGARSAPGPGTTRAILQHESRAAGASAAPSYIKQSRTMIVTRLEQEHALAKERLERTLERVRSSTDPEVVRARKTVAALEDLLARIDVVLVEAVERHPTIFDFSHGAPASSGARSQKGLGSGSSANSELPPGTPADAEHVLFRARDRLEWLKRLREKGHASQSEVDAEMTRYEAIKARCVACHDTAGDRVGWAKRMFETGYVSQQEYDAALRTHYGNKDIEKGGESVTPKPASKTENKEAPLDTAKDRSKREAGAEE